MQLQRYLADLIQKNCPAVGQFKTTGAVLYSAGKRPFYVPEELAFKKFAGNRRTIHPNQRAIAALTALMNGAGNQLFTGTGFTTDQHAGERGRNQFHLLQYLLNGVTLSNDILEIMADAKFFLQIVVLSLEALLHLLNFCEGFPQSLFGLLSLTNILEHHHRTYQLIIFADRRTRILDRKMTAILAPEHFIVHVMDGTIFKRRVDRALVCRITRTTGFTVVQQSVHRLTN